MRMVFVRAYKFQVLNVCQATIFERWFMMDIAAGVVGGAAVGDAFTVTNDHCETLQR